jgi:hypothetical protein
MCNPVRFRSLIEFLSRGIFGGPGTVLFCDAGRFGRPGLRHDGRMAVAVRRVTFATGIPRFRFSGNMGVTEIERLIKKLELDKEILADQEDEEAAD